MLKRQINGKIYFSAGGATSILEYDPVANTNLYVANFGINVTTSYDGFTILPDASGTITGTIYVYGYVNS